MEIKYSIVVPLKDEEDNIAILINEIEPIMNKTDEPWELICIDDGSKDSTPAILASLKNKKPYLIIVTFKENYGQSSAFDAGFKRAKGEYIITMDGDLQNDPKDIPKFLEKAKDFDMICGRRVNRKDTISKKITSYFANKIRSKICNDGVRDTGCSLKLYRKSCLEKIKLYEGMHRFLPALFNNENFRILEIPVNHRFRKHGKSKYNIFNRSFNTIADMLAVRWMRKRHLQYFTKEENA